MSDKMNAIVFKDLGEFEYTQRPVPQVSHGDDVQIRILAASICGTDVHILRNPPGIKANRGIILGHECVGEVTEIGSDVIDLKVGDHIILDNNVPCGSAHRARQEIVICVRIWDPWVFIKMESSPSMP